MTGEWSTDAGKFIFCSKECRSTTPPGAPLDLWSRPSAELSTAV